MSKFLSKKNIAQIIEYEKNQGKKIVVVDGCFDIIGVDIIKFLKVAKEKGDVLVVVLRESSILPLIDKVEILSAFEMVDYVSEFDKDQILEADINISLNKEIEEEIKQKIIKKNL